MNLIGPAHCRAARAWLRWSQGDLAKACGVSLSTIADFERGERAMMKSNRLAVVAVLRDAGIRFLENGIEYDPED